MLIPDVDGSDTNVRPGSRDWSLRVLDQAASEASREAKRDELPQRMAWVPWPSHGMTKRPRNTGRLSRNHHVEKICPCSSDALLTPRKVMVVLSDSVIVVLPPVDCAPCSAVEAADAP